MERDHFSIPANIMRTMPYTSYVAVGSYAAIFFSAEAAWLLCGLGLNEVLNAGLKAALRKVFGAENSILRRPEGAVDSGIYPQHYPRPSSSSGMPSGHSQTAGFLAAILMMKVSDAVDDSELGEGDEALPVAWLLRLSYICLIALAVMISRTHFGGPLSLRVDGRTVAHHTVFQVIVGACIGLQLGFAAFAWYSGHWTGRSALLWHGFAALNFASVVVSAAMNAKGCPCARSEGDSKSDSSDEEWSTDECLSSDNRATEESSASEPEPRQRWQQVGAAEG